MPKVIYHAKDRTVRRAAVWRVSRRGDLTRDYEFVDGVATEVAEKDLAVLLNPDAVGGRKLVLAKKEDEKPRSHGGGQAAPTSAGSPGGGNTPPPGAGGAAVGGSAGRPDEKTDAGGGGAGKTEK